MTIAFRGACAMLACAVAAGPCWGQAGIPVRPFVPSFRPLPIHPVPIHGPSHGPKAGPGQPADPAVVIGILAAIGAVIVLAIAIAVWRNRTVAHLRVVRTPPGEAPEEIRRAWIGVELPLRRWELKPGRHPTEGVLSQHFSGMIPSYAVSGRRAVKALAAHSRDAAAWWRKNAPHVLAPGYRLSFPTYVFEPLNELRLGSDGKAGVWQREFAPWEK